MPALNVFSEHTCMAAGEKGHSTKGKWGTLAINGRAWNVWRLAYNNATGRVRSVSVPASNRRCHESAVQRPVRQNVEGVLWGQKRGQQKVNVTGVKWNRVVRAELYAAKASVVGNARSRWWWQCVSGV